MRKLLLPYKGPDRVNYLCIVASGLLNVNNLAPLVALLSGFESVKATLNPDLAQALENLRLVGIAPASRREMSILVDTYIRHHDMREARSRDGSSQSQSHERGYERRYRFSNDLSFEPRWTSLAPSDIEEAHKELIAPLHLRERGDRHIHNPLAGADIDHIRSGYTGTVEPLNFIPPEPVVHDTSRGGSEPGFVSWSSLIDIAKKFDTIDIKESRQKEGGQSWFRRLHDEAGSPTAHLLKCGPDGLQEAKGINLSGIKHFIGLPGSGKTTLLYLLAGYLHNEGWRACFLFPSIEVATGFIEKLQLYGIGIGLLYGQGENTRTRHALNFASSLGNHNNGFAATRTVAPLFATNCALAGYASDEEIEFPHTTPPCLIIKQRLGDARKKKDHQCALASVCGYQASERGLAQYGIWAGHILSLDRPVSKLYGDYDINHFEHVARYFDILVVDEADNAQAALDQRGTPIMRLTGSAESLWSTLIADLHQPAASGRNAFVSGENLPQILAMTGRFGIASERLVSRITHFRTWFKEKYANTLLTSLSIIADMFPEDFKGSEQDSELHYRARQGLESLWDMAVRKVAFRGTPIDAEDDGENELTLETSRAFKEASEKLNVSESAVSDFYYQLLDAIEMWERDGNIDSVIMLASVLRNVPGITSEHDDQTFFEYSALLISVSLVILQHFGLAPHLRLMNAEGLVSDSVFEARLQRDVQAIIPESLVGRLSGVRYIVSEEGNIEVAQIGFSGTPRTLPGRMHRLAKNEKGLAVLLTSATSMLESSPSFHIADGPHYVLRRPNANYGWKESKYVFLPLQDPRDPEKPLRFSGAGIYHQEENLKAMVDQLLKGNEFSRVYDAIERNDVVDGIKRKAGFVVNSYAQCRLLYDYIAANYPALRSHVRYLKQANLNGLATENAVTAAEIEGLNWDESWDVLIFPMAAIGRGVNIVFPEGPRANQALLGSLFFLTRPHPRIESLQLIQGLVSRESEKFDRLRFDSTAKALSALAKARSETVSMARYLLRMPLMIQSLGKYAEPFVADQMILILQTIGRAMRGDRPAFVYFVDAAWAPRSAVNAKDTPTSSMLVMMQEVLDKCLNHPDSSTRECYQNLYKPFAKPLGSVENLNVKGKR